MVVEIRFNFTIHHSGNFEWNPSLEYLGGKVSVMGNVDLDLLNHFDIQDVYADTGDPLTLGFII